MGLTQADLAGRAGLSVRGISDLERGARKAPHSHTVRQLALALELTDEQCGVLLGAARRGDANRPEALRRNLPTVVAAFDLDGRVTTLNDAAAQVFRS